MTEGLTAQDATALLDWKRRVSGLYERIRTTSDPPAAWQLWRDTRNTLFAEHPQSPMPAEQRSGIELPLFDYDGSKRVPGIIVDASPEHYEVATSGQETMAFTRFATVSFTLDGEELSLELYWLEGYGGGLFLPFRDATSGKETYGAGRYLFDTVKGADLGVEGDQLVLDFNFAYNPSCAYDPKWVCPLAPPANRLDIAIPAGERI
jgi:uncharacterized protein